MNKYTDRAVILRQFFDEETHETIVRFLEDFVPYLPLQSDRHLPDNESKFNRRFANNLPFFVNIHNQLIDVASEVFGEKVKPSYSFMSLYDDGGRCPLHIDRPQCRYTIDYLIRQESKEPWPICISKQMNDKQVRAVENPHPDDEHKQTIIDSAEWTQVNLQANDAVCYSGTNAWHYRPTASHGTADLVFWHFVPRKFNGSLD